MQTLTTIVKMETKDLQINGGFVPYDVEWYRILPNGWEQSIQSNFGIQGNNDGEDLENLEAGTYRVVVTDALCGTATESFEVICICNDCYGISASIGEGSISLDIECEDSNNFTFAWSDGGVGNPRTGLEIGNYCVTATSSNGCSLFDCWEVTSTCSPTELTNANVEITSSCTAAPMSGAIEVLSPLENGLFYIWTGPNNYINSGHMISNLLPGEYCVAIENLFANDGCPEATGCFMVEPDGEQCCSDCYPLDANVSQGSIHVDLECEESGGFSYVWSDGGMGNPRQNLAPGEYCVTATSKTGCSLSGCWEVGEACPEVMQLDNNNATTSCSSSNNGSISLQNLPGWSGVMYIWNGPNGYSGFGTDISNLAGGDYCVTVIQIFNQGCPLAEGCFSVGGSGQILVDDLQHVSECIQGVECVDPGGQIGCTNDGAISITVLTNDSYSVSWTGPNGFTSNEEDINSLEQGDYTVTIQFGENSACEITQEFSIEFCKLKYFNTFYERCETINLNNSNQINVDLEGEGVVPVNDDAPCIGSIDVEIEGGTTSYVFHWEGPNGFVALTEDIEELCEGEYCLMIDD